jgi:predicted enzyme related to lactoylglutathione lyase
MQQPSKETIMSATEFAITLDCANAAELAAFWAEVLGRPADPGATEDFAAIGLAEGSNGRPVWMFHKVPEAKTAKNRAHVDLVTADLSAEVDRLVRLGASRVADIEESGAQWTTLTDPAGNEFDLVAQPAG